MRPPEVSGPVRPTRVFPADSIDGNLPVRSLARPLQGPMKHSQSQVTGSYILREAHSRAFNPSSTILTFSAVNSGYIGRDKNSSAHRSATGKEPLLYPKKRYAS